MYTYLYVYKINISIYAVSYTHLDVYKRQVPPQFYMTKPPLFVKKCNKDTCFIQGSLFNSCDHE